MKTTIGAMALVLFATTSGAQQLPATSAFIQNANHIFIENMAALGVPQPPGLQPRVIAFIQDTVASHAAYRVTIDYEGFDGQMHQASRICPITGTQSLCVVTVDADKVLASSGVVALSVDLAAVQVQVP